MQQHEVTGSSGFETNLPQSLSSFRQTANIHRALTSFDKEVWPLLKRVAPHLSARWSHCKKMILAGRLSELLVNHKDPDGKEVPDSSILHQHKRAVQLGRDALSAAEYILIAELCGRDSTVYWQRVHAIRENLLESNYLDPCRRNLFLEAKNELGILIRELNDTLFESDGLIVRSIDADTLHGEEESIQRKHRHQAVLSGLVNQFHNITNGFNSMNITYSMLLKTGRSFITQLNALKSQSMTEEQLEHAIKELTISSISTMKIEFPDANQNTQSTRGLLRKHHFEGLLLTAGSTSLVDGPAQSIDFSLSSLYEIHEERMLLVPSLSNKNTKLDLNLELEAVEAFGKIRLFHRAMLGWVFDNLILNSLQALSRSDIQDSNIIIRARQIGQQLKFEVISQNLFLENEAIDQINANISDYQRAKARASAGKGGNGFPDITRLLTHKSCLASQKPVVHNCEEGFCVSFQIDWQKLS